MFKGDRIRIRGILLGEMVQQEMGGGTNKLECQCSVKRKTGQVFNCNEWGILQGTVLSQSVQQNSDYFKDKMLLMQAQENGAVLDEEELLFLAGEQGNTFDADVDNQRVQDLALNEDNIFQANECDTFDSDVDDEPTAQSIFMANLSSVGSANPQAGPSNASILSEAKGPTAIYDGDELLKPHSCAIYCNAQCLHDLNECFRAENAKVKQHYKELYDSIKIMRAKTTDQNNSLLSEIEHRKVKFESTYECVTLRDCKPKVLALVLRLRIVCAMAVSFGTYDPIFMILGDTEKTRLNCFKVLFRLDRNSPLENPCARKNFRQSVLHAGVHALTRISSSDGGHEWIDLVIVIVPEDDASEFGSGANTLTNGSCSVAANVILRQKNARFEHHDEEDD
ncbi:hypothetical protein Tco_1182096 [Tanacetum coccineum]